MFLVSLAFAFWAFVLAFHIFQEYGKSVIAALVTFIISFIALTYELNTLSTIMLLFFPLLTIFLTFKKD